MKLPILWTMFAANRVSCIVSQMLHTVRQNQHDVQFSFLICQPSTLCLAKSLGFYKSNAEIVGHLVLVGATAKMYKSMSEKLPLLLVVLLLRNMQKC